MADKLVTLTQPVEADLDRANLRYSGGLIQSVEFYVNIRTTDAEEPVKRRSVEVQRADLPAGIRDGLDQLATRAIQAISNRYGF